MSTSADQYDPYEKQGGGGKPGKPAVSWKKSDVGDEFEGIVVPPDPFNEAKGYAFSQEWEADEDGNRYPRVWAPKGYMKDGKPWRGPVREHEHAAFCTAQGRQEEARPVTQPDIMFETDYGKFEFVSGPAKQRIAEEGGTDDGVRRVIISGQSLREAHEEALQAVGTDRPQPGQHWKIRLAKQEPTPQGGHKNTFEVVITAPTDKTMEVVRASVARRKAEAQSADDPYAKAGAGAGAQQEEPPF